MEAELTHKTVALELSDLHELFAPATHQVISPIASIFELIAGEDSKALAAAVFPPARELAFFVACQLHFVNSVDFLPIFSLVS